MTACPDETTLRQFLAGELDPDANRAIDTHLDSCADCQRQLEQAVRLPDALRAILALAGGPEAAGASTDVSSPTGEHAPQAGPAPQVPGYEVLGELGKGGMGVVYRARDVRLRREVAVKVLAERLAEEPQVRQRFLEEAHIAAQLQHPGVAAVHELGELADGRPFLAMKLVKGETLADVLGRRASPQEGLPRLVQVFAQVCQTVAYAHEHRVIHRDLKPGNVMVGTFGEVQVMDWGLAKVLRGGDPPRQEGAAEPPATAIATPRDGAAAWQTQGALGTWAYMAPEQARGQAERVDARSDVFSLGALLCEVLTGRPPYEGSNRELARRQAEDAELGAAIARLNGCAADRALVELAMACLAARPEGRPADADAMARAVAAYQAEVQERLRRAELARAQAEVRVAEGRKRYWVQLALAAALGLLLAVVGAAVWWKDRQAIRSAEAVTEHLRQCEAALRADDLTSAAQALEQAKGRMAEGGADHLKDRLARCRADLEILQGLKRVDDLFWQRHVLELHFWGNIKLIQGSVSLWLSSAALMQAIQERAEVFERYGVVPGTTPLDEAARRINGSLVKYRLLTALEQWLRGDSRTSAAVLAILRAADPDGFRCAVRAATMPRAIDIKRVRDLADAPAMMEQPAWFAAVLCDRLHPVRRDQRERILREAVQRRPGDFALLMSLGVLYWEDPDPARRVEREGWFRAALAVRPESAAAWIMLGLALWDKRDLEGAIAAYRKAIRLSPDNSQMHSDLGHMLGDKGDLDGAASAYREALRLRSCDPYTRTALGLTLRAKGDLGGAVAAFRGGIRDISRLGQTRAAQILDDVEFYLRQTEQWRELLPRLPDIAADRVEPKTPVEAVEFAHLCVQPFQKRYVLAARFYADAFGAQPSLADDLRQHHRYNAACAAALAAAGDGSDAATLGESERRYWRQQALAWLRADLAAWQGALANATPQDRQAAAETLTHWQKDPDFASVRQPAALAWLPLADALDWAQLWADVATVLRRAKGDR